MAQPSSQVSILNRPDLLASLGNTQSLAVAAVPHPVSLQHIHLTPSTHQAIGGLPTLPTRVGKTSPPHHPTIRTDLKPYCDHLPTYLPCQELTFIFLVPKRAQQNQGTNKGVFWDQFLDHCSTTWPVRHPSAPFHDLQCCGRRNKVLEPWCHSSFKFRLGR